MGNVHHSEHEFYGICLKSLLLHEHHEVYCCYCSLFNSQTMEWLLRQKNLRHLLHFFPVVEWQLAHYIFNNKMLQKLSNSFYQFVITVIRFIYLIFIPFFCVLNIVIHVLLSYGYFCCTIRLPCSRNNTLFKKHDRTRNLTT